MRALRNPPPRLLHTDKSSEGMGGRTVGFRVWLCLPISPWPGWVQVKEGWHWVPRAVPWRGLGGERPAVGVFSTGLRGVRSGWLGSPRGRWGLKGDLPKLVGFQGRSLGFGFPKSPREWGFRGVSLLPCGLGGQEWSWGPQPSVNRSLLPQVSWVLYIYTRFEVVILKDPPAPLLFPHF